MRKFKVIIELILVGFFLFVNHTAYAWINLYNDYDNQYPALEWDWDYSGGDTHTLTVWNNGSTDEDFIDVLSVLNYVKHGSTVLNWDNENNYFTDGAGTIISVTGYDGIFDNTNGEIPNMSVGKWPYFSYGDLLASGNRVSNTFNVYGPWTHLETDEITRELKPVPEPSSMVLFSIGIIGLFFAGFRKKFHFGL